MKTATAKIAFSAGGAHPTDGGAITNGPTFDTFTNFHDFCAILVTYDCTGL